MAYERALIALLLLATIAGAGDCCGWRAVPILPEEWRSGGGNNTYYNNYTTYNVTSTTYNNYTNYSITTVNYSDYWWYVSGTWLVNNRTAATSGVNVSGVNGNTYLTGNNINFDRVGPNYIQATDGSGSLYFGSGGTSGVIGLLNTALVNSLLINGHGVGVYTTADEFEFTVAGAAYASENVSTPLVNTSCINLANELVCSWAAVNGSMGGGGSESFNGTFNETEGLYIYNSTPYKVDFNATLLNETIDSRSIAAELDPHWTGNESSVARTGNCSTGEFVVNSTVWGVYCAAPPSVSAETDPHWTGNYSLVFDNLSTTWTWLLSLAADNSTHFANASLQSGEIQSVNNSVVHIAGSETVTGEKTFQDNFTVTGTGVRALFTDGVLTVVEALARGSGVFAYDQAIVSFLSTGDNAKGGVVRGEKVRVNATGDKNPVQASDNMFSFEANAWDGAEFFGGGSLSFNAVESWTTTAHGTEALLRTTPIGGVTQRVGLNISQSGIITLPYQSSVRAYNSSVTAVVGTTTRKAVFNAETYDVQGEYANSRFTPREPGTYQVSATLDFATAGTTKYLQIRRTGSVVKEVLTDGRRTSLTISDQLQLVVGDYLEIWVRTDGGTNKIYGGSENMTVTIMKVA